MTRPLRIGLDIDGVIAQYKDIPLDHRTADVYDKLKPVSEEVMTMFAFLADHYTVFLVSSRRYHSAQEHTLEWLKRHLPSWDKDIRFELLTDVAPDEKWMIAHALKLDYLVDDNPGVFRYGSQKCKSVLVAPNCSPHTHATISDLTELYFVVAMSGSVL